MFLFDAKDRIGGYTVDFCGMYGSYYEKYYVLDREQNLWFAKILHLDDLKPFSFDPEGQVLEAEIAPLLSHRNLCRFGASGTMEKEGHRLLYIISEVAHGDSLSDLIHRKETLTGDELMQVMESLLSALESLHSQSRPIIHNGITPEKIRAWRREFGSLRLIGLSRARFSDLAPDPSSWHGQDLHYVAPERLEGGGSVRSDIFSAAAVMYELVFGARPWESELTGSTPERQAELFNEKRRSPLPIPSSRLIDIDEAKLAALRRALSFDPEKRFASAKEFLEALRGNAAAAGSREERSEEDGSADEKASVPDTEPQEQEEAQEKAADEEPEQAGAPGKGFAGVAGMEDIKALMQRKIIDVLKNPELAGKYRIQIPNGMLLYGPPGCGKSFIAEKFAEEAGWNYRLIKSSDLASTYVHGSQEKIGALFDEARKKAPMILNFDEFDALVPDRGRTDSVHVSGEVNEFLSQMNNCGKDRVFVIASSNRPDLIDPAVRRKGRLDQMIYIPVPDPEAREGMFRVQMKGRPQAKGIDFRRLASLTENFVASDIAFIVNDAAEKAFEERADITEKMLEDAIRRTSPSVSPDDISYYDGIRMKVEKSAKERNHRPIGFIQK